jgi:hypothetical protein
MTKEQAVGDQKSTLFVDNNLHQEMRHGALEKNS